MQISIDLKTASLKDAEHLIFIVGAYFGMTNLPAVGALQVTTGPDKVASLIRTGADVTVLPDGSAAPLGNPDNSDPAAVFGGQPGNVQPPTPTPPPTVAPIAAAPVGTPATPPAPAVSAPSGVEVDADGLPWDQRINAAGEGGAKPKNADGRWRKKRGLNDAALIQRVQAELRATMAASGGVPVPPVAASAVAPVVPTVPPAAPSPPVPPVAPSAPVAPVDPTTFEALMPRVTAAVAAGTLPNAALLAACTEYQLPNIPSLAQRPDLVPYVWARMRQLYPALV